MDNPVLNRVAARLEETLVGALVRDLVADGPDRVRLTLDSRAGTPLAVSFSTRPGRPWIGRPRSRRRPPGPPSPFQANARRVLRGASVTGVVKPRAERWVAIEFGHGYRLVAEVTPQTPNLVLLDPAGRVDCTERRPGKRSRARLEAGVAWRAAPIPDGAFSPFGRDLESIEARLSETRPDGAREVSRALFGLGVAAARLLLDEAARRDEPLARVVVRRLAEPGEPVIQKGGDRGDGIDRLWPWPPPDADPAGLIRGDDAVATAGLFHEACDLAAERADRERGVRAILDREIARLRHAVQAARTDRARFEDPDGMRRRGEALLAGLHTAERDGDRVIVADPYSTDGGTLVLEVPAAEDLLKAADRFFALNRRGRRGLERAGRRIELLSDRLARLERLRPHREQPIDDLEQAMRRERIPISVPGGTRAVREASRMERPRLEGVRVHVAPSGETILVGKTGRDNQRLTFRLAAPDDFWFHALDAHGAHVVLRNPERRTRPPRDDALAAAGLAAWYSDVRGQTAADVQWTRRKYVRKVRGAAPGTVQIKRFETLRVKPTLPRSEEGIP